MLDFATVPERMYEAAFLPEMWTPLLDELAIATGSSAGGIGIYWPEMRGITTSFSLTPYELEWEQTADAAEIVAKYVRTKKLVNNGFFQMDMARGDWADIPDIKPRLASYLERGYGPQTATIAELFNGELITLEFARIRDEPRYDAETLAKLNQIETAFRQTALFASRLQFERAKSSLDTLADLGLPAALLGVNGQVLYTNALFETAEPYVYKLKNGQLALRGSDLQRKAFAETMQQARHDSVSMAIPSTMERNAAVLNFMPMVRDARSIFSMNCTIVMLNPVSTSRGVPAPELIVDMFGLTPAEARLSATLASGLSIRDSAAKMGITVGTARSYLNRVFSKTGTEQQSELVSLLKGTSVNHKEQTMTGKDGIPVPKA